MRYCENCGGSRRHAHFTSEGTRYNFCQSCRKRGEQRYLTCGWCGISRGHVNRYCDTNNHPVPDDEQDVEQDSGEAFEDDMGTTAVSNRDSRTHPADSRSLAESTRWTRRQCKDCYAAFDFVTDYERHLQDNEFICEEHKACLGWKDIWEHVKAKRHTRCFLSTCTSEHSDPRSSYTNKDIENHIWLDHVKTSAGQRR